MFTERPYHLITFKHSCVNSRHVIEKNNLLLIELKDYESFKKKVWLGYFQELEKDVSILLDSYNSKKDQLKEIISEAIDTRTDWENAVDTFNLRFKDWYIKYEDFLAEKLYHLQQINYNIRTQD